MDNPIYLRWQQWEGRVQEWLNSLNDDLEISDTLPFDRRILTVLTVKYQVLYTDIDKETATTKAKKHDERKSIVKLSKNKESDGAEEKERHRDKEKLFDDFTGRLLTPQEVSTENSVEWQEFNQLYEWHGLTFLRRFEQCLRQFVSELISATPEYQTLSREPALVSPVAKIENEVYGTKNDGHVFLSVDIKSANFALLQHIHAIDAQTYPTWADYLSFFVGSRPLFVQSKILRMRCLGDLPQYRKLEALWTHFTATIYRTTLCPIFDEMDINVRCMALSGDEVVLHLDASMREEKVRDLIQTVQSCLTKKSPIVKFHVQAYRLRTFHWRKKHTCFARLFIGQDDGQFDLKCVPNREQNYNSACEDFRKFSGL